MNCGCMLVGGRRSLHPAQLAQVVLGALRRLFFGVATISLEQSDLALCFVRSSSWVASCIELKAYPRQHVSLIRLLSSAIFLLDSSCTHFN